MNRESIEFILSVLPKERTIFYDFPDRYALLLLEQAVGDEGRDIADIANSNLGTLLKKERIDGMIKSLDHPKINRENLLDLWPPVPFAYRLSLGTWPSLDEKPSLRWSQITRWGWSLVLQLNLSASHRRKLSEKVPYWREMIDGSGHPIARNGELTLAWSRIDLDFETDEALIEEIQSDWIRDARYWAQATWSDDHRAWKDYYEQTLKPQVRKWPETMLTATLWFLLEELGLKSIFFHTYSSGKRLKNMEQDTPPRSIYTSLPKKFCFEVTHNGPLFVRDSARKELRDVFRDPRTRWYLHEFGEDKN